jgi:hypothetical protein
MSAPPKSYDEAAYIKWHNAEYATDNDLGTKVKKYRDSLKKSAKPALDALAQVLDQIGAHTGSEVEVQSAALVDGEFELPTNDIGGKSAGRYDVLFKPTDSIIEKMWRKNLKAAKTERVHLGNLQEQVTDLVRTSVTGSTMFSCRLFAARLRNWKTVIKNRTGRALPPTLNIIEGIEVDEEAKLQSGYFAYHALASCTGGLKIEVQIFSRIMAAWRLISHAMYEKTRIGEKPDIAPGSHGARLVSLGHALHLAEWVHDGLIQESVDRLGKRK